MSNSRAGASGARDRLIAAAQELYALNGVAATTPREVLERSSVGQGSMYHHFPSKRDLASAAVTRTTAETLRIATDALTGDEPGIARVTSYLRRDRDAVAGCRVGRLTADPLVMTDDGIRGSVGEYFSSLIDLVTDALIDDGLTADAARDRATTAIAVIQGGFVLSRALGDPAQMQRAVEGFIALLETPTPSEEA